jgi:pyruvate,water dikinase
VNDFFAMIAFGVLGRLVERWLPGSPPTLANDLLCSEGGIISTEPARRVIALARKVNASPDLAALFAGEPDDRALWKALSTQPSIAPFHHTLQEYLERFGDRCVNELKLETMTLREDPAFLLKMVRAYAAVQSEVRSPKSEVATDDPEPLTSDLGPSETSDLGLRTSDPGIAARRAAEADVRRELQGPRLRLFMAVLRETRARVRDRENLRFERTRVFGLVRRIFRALGEQLAAAGALAAPEEVFYLTREEIFGYVEGTAVDSDLRALAALRRREFEEYERGPAPPDRFITNGPPATAAPGGEPRPGEVGGAGTLQGTGCCPGRVRAPVCLVRDPNAAPELAGRILVAERTDPGWTLLFPAAAGLLVQRGSLLSHSAIVAREIGLPCIVAIPHLLQTLQDGEWVEMDGVTGIVQRIGGGTADERR